MPGRNKQEAIDSFCGFFKESLSCITDSFLHPVQHSANQYLLTYEPPAPLLCQTEDRTLSVVQTFSCVRETDTSLWKVRTNQYSYSLNGTGGEIVSYHWHPIGTAVCYPHLHVGSVANVHFPTARISIEKFIRMLIDYYDIEPLLADSRWKRILDKNNKAFDKMATWH